MEVACTTCDITARATERSAYRDAVLLASSQFPDDLPLMLDHASSWAQLVPSDLHTQLYLWHANVVNAWRLNNELHVLSSVSAATEAKERFDTVKNSIERCLLRCELAIDRMRGTPIDSTDEAAKRWQETAKLLSLHTETETIKWQVGTSMAFNRLEWLKHLRDRLSLRKPDNEKSDEQKDTDQHHAELLTNICDQISGKRQYLTEMERQKLGWTRLSELITMYVYHIHKSLVTEPGELTRDQRALLTSLCKLVTACADSAPRSDEHRRMAESVNTSLHSMADKQGRTPITPFHLRTPSPSFGAQTTTMSELPAMSPLASGSGGRQQSPDTPSLARSTEVLSSTSPVSLSSETWPIYHSAGAPELSHAEQLMYAGNMYKRMGQYAEARSMYERASGFLDQTERTPCWGRPRYWLQRARCSSLWSAACDDLDESTKKAREAVHLTSATVYLDHLRASIAPDERELFKRFVTNAAQVGGALAPLREGLGLTSIDDFVRIWYAPASLRTPTKRNEQDKQPPTSSGSTSTNDSAEDNKSRTDSEDESVGFDGGS